MLDEKQTKIFDKVVENEFMAFIYTIPYRFCDELCDPKDPQTFGFDIEGLTEEQKGVLRDKAIDYLKDFLNREM